MLTSRYAMFAWRWHDLIYFYNDSYISILGKRHPAALGRPARVVWGEIWDVVEPRVEKALLEGQATLGSE